ncbi:MAG: GNAT family N-acetyltransferase [Anaerolineae bacterium]
MITYVPGTPEIKQKMQATSESNACDFIRFDSDYFSLFALSDGKPVALVGAKIKSISEPLQDESEVFIDIIEVTPAFFRQGIGTELVARVIEWAGSRNATQVRAWSEECREAALMLWRNMGFTFSRVDFQHGEQNRYGFYVARRVSNLG